jgi:hypothetical protein
VADGFVAGQAQAAINVLGRTDDAFFCRSVQGGSRNGLSSSLSNGRAGESAECPAEQCAADLTARQGNAPLAASLNQRLALFERETPIRQQSTGG